MPANIAHHLREILADAALDNQVESGTVELCERDRSARLRRITITGIPSNTLIVKLQSHHRVSSHFRDGDHNKTCDWILFTAHGSNRYAICIEMKSSDAGLSKAYTQLKSSAAFVDYLFSICKWLKNDNSTPEWQRRYICLHSVPLCKERTRYTVGAAGDTPHSCCCLTVKNDEHIYLRQLIRT